MQAEQILASKAPDRQADTTHAVNSLGALRGQSWLTVQTYQARQLIHGRQATQDKASIVGLVGFADRLRIIWQAARDDDPYADWWLIKIHEALEQARHSLSQYQEKAETQLAQMTAMEVTVAQSQKPYRIQLQFANPYAYQGAQLIAEYDRLVRTVLTCGHMGQLDDASAQNIINFGAHKIRGTFVLPLEYRLLGIDRKSLQQSGQSSKAVSLMGELPEEVFSGAHQAPLVPRRRPSQKPLHRPMQLQSLPSPSDTENSTDQNHDT